ncbi:DUF1214 domain-containing protein [Conexibacter stalactiti]|uniref:DUF1214 domain-containing protein n=1 Tax=Conexibacter stalactiti TaxID=1940611 RepID=A0ABU4HTY8_9ACTN|nr:DUF1214 domain-containing protein [Conexibacter stalactiti]MDW5596264.1 DUF1214 domain-containing protein [Conexibacter stalactiti]MEC5036906.1 DUF1214 domain-containing protein [Conexibacter stalactiti]
MGHSRTTRAFMLGRSFINENPGMDPAPTVELIKRMTKIHPYAQGGSGTSIATLLQGEVRRDPPADIPETVFVEASGKAFNTIPPNDVGFYELLNELVQEQPAGSTEIELAGELAAIGIVKGEPFAPVTPAICMRLTGVGSQYPRAGSQSYPSPAATANDDGPTTVTFGPERPSDSPASDWIQTTEGKGWFPILRLYSPLQSFFDMSWRPSEIEPQG